MNENIDKDRDIKVKGELYTELPEDLFIPPDALRIILEEFEGPLDMLLYLIKKQNNETTAWHNCLVSCPKY